VLHARARTYTHKITKAQLGTVISNATDYRETAHQAIFAAYIGCF